ncbi:MAG: carboxypeptidase regulatory-like domain-containing protein [Gammaproteobacteria bacterium HGW-Gammaproteobacteria-1]|jgi:hypothetical protein|nr:MAG: carboxypeptidase regulatory-like domain-containing protein [Gammaproteobacteria bacterium HGW-Gammaproteobacteria-1]
MIDEMDRQVTAWIASALDGVEVRLAAPAQMAQDKCIDLYLLDLLPAAPTAQGNAKLFQLSLRYLITAWAETPEESHRLLGELLFRAAEHPEYDVELAPLSPSAWAALGSAPRPSFLLRVPLRRERKLPQAKLIREPMVLRESTSMALRGMVVGPNDIPIAGARVEITGLQRATYTDHKGCFLFSAVPAEPSRKRLRIKAKGREMAVLAEQGVNAPEPLVIHVDIAEV